MSRAVSNGTRGAAGVSPQRETLASRDVNHHEDPVARTGKTGSPPPRKRTTTPPVAQAKTPPPREHVSPPRATATPTTRPPVVPGSLSSPTTTAANKPLREHHAYSFDTASDAGSNSSICGPSGFLRDRSPSLPTGSMPTTARDAKDEVVSATKYYFDTQTLVWKESPIRLRVRHPNRGLGQDDLFVFFSVEMLEDEHMLKLIKDDASRHNYQVTHSFASDGPNMCQDFNASGTSNGLGGSQHTEKHLPRAIPFLARMYRHGVSDVCEDDYFGLSQCQAMCEELCRHYNQTKLFQATSRNLDKLTVRPLPLMTGRFLIRIPMCEIPLNAVAAKKGFFSYRTQDSKELFAFLEPDVLLCDLMNIQIAPSMEEFFQINLNNNEHPRRSETDSLNATQSSWLTGGKFFICQYPRAEQSWRKPEYAQLAEAFSHYTHTCTQHEMVICGLRRGGGFLTDPLVHTRDKKQFGMGNGGLKEITKWSVRHTCNETCAFMHLPAARGNGSESPVNRFDSLQMATSTYYVDLAQLLCQSMPYSFLSKDNDESPPSQLTQSPMPPMSLAAPAPLPAAAQQASQKPASPRPEDNNGSKTPSIISGMLPSQEASPRPKTLKTVKKDPPSSPPGSGQRAETVKGRVVATAAAPADPTTATPLRPQGTTEPIKGTVVSTPKTGPLSVHKVAPVKRSPPPPAAVVVSRTSPPPAAKVELAAKTSPMPAAKLVLDEGSPSSPCRVDFGKTSPPPPLRIEPMKEEHVKAASPVFTVTSTTAAAPTSAATNAGSTAGSPSGAGHARTFSTSHANTSFNSVNTPRTQLATPPASAPLPAVLTLPHRRLAARNGKGSGETPINSARTDSSVTPPDLSASSIGGAKRRSRQNSDASNPALAKAAEKATEKAPRRPKSTTAPSGRLSGGSTSSNQLPKREPTPRRSRGSTGAAQTEAFHSTTSSSGYLKTADRPPVVRRRRKPEVPSTRPVVAPEEEQAPKRRSSSPPQRQPHTRKVPPSPGAASGANTPAAFMRCATENSTLSRSRTRDDSFTVRARDDGFDVSLVEEPKLFDMKNVFPATKYVFDLKTLSWHGRRTFVRVCNPDCGVAQGGMRVCFDVNEVDPADPHSEEILNVAKMYRRTISKVVEEDYFNEGEVQHLCGEIVKQFNEESLSGTMTARNRVELEMTGCSVVIFNRDDIPEHLYLSRKGFFSYRTTDSHRVLFTMEPKLIGNFTKYNGNFGESYATNERPISVELRWRRLQIFEAAEALSHFSLMKSDGGLLLCDVQGVQERLTDPEVHTYNREGMGIGNMGQEGINRFIEKHKCTKVCRCLGLEPFTAENGKPQLTENSKKTNYLLKLANRLNDRNRPGRIIDPPVKGKEL